MPNGENHTETTAGSSSPRSENLLDPNIDPSSLGSWAHFSAKDADLEHLKATDDDYLQMCMAQEEVEELIRQCAESQRKFFELYVSQQAGGAK